MDHVHRQPGPVRSRRAALLVLCTGFLLVILDQTVVNVALPSIRSDLGFSQTGLAWVVNAYLIAFGGLLLLAGRLGDLVGRRRVFTAGLWTFTAASLACGLSPTPALLIAARLVQGAGAAMSSAVILGMIVALFPAPREQARAIGVYSFVAASGSALGLLASGVLTELLSWHWIFLINVPIGAAAAIAAPRLLAAEHAPGLRGGADASGAALAVCALMLIVYGVLAAPAHGWSSVQVVAPLLAGVALGAAFVAHEARARTPLLPLRLFRLRSLAVANTAQLPMIAALMSQFFLGALLLQRVERYTPIEVGLAFLPVAVVIGIFSLLLSPRLVLRFGSRGVLATGLVLAAAGLGLFARVPVGAVYLRDLLPAMVLLGTGAGLALPALMSAAMAGVAAADAGVASGVFNTVQQVAGALGISVLTALASSRSGSAGGSPAHALASGYHLGLAVAGALAAGAAVIVCVLARPSRSTAVADGQPSVEAVDLERAA